VTKEIVSKPLKIERKLTGKKDTSQQQAEILASSSWHYH
jgi:hypothetical protein